MAAVAQGEVIAVALTGEWLSRKEVDRSLWRVADRLTGLGGGRWKQEKADSRMSPTA